MNQTGNRRGGFRILFMLYVFFLPFETFINIPQDGVFTLFKSFSLNIAMVGCFLIFLGGEIKRIHKIVRSFGILYLFMAVYSLLAALILTIAFANPYESPLSCIVGDVILYFEMLLSVVFICFCLGKGSTYEDICTALNWQIVFALMMGMIQLLAFLGIGPAVNLYGHLSSVLHLADFEMLSKMERGVTLFGNEPSTLSMYCFITIPYILYRCFFVKKNRGLFIIALIGFVIVFVASLSTQSIGIFLAELVVFIILALSKEKLYNLLVRASFIIGLSMAVLLCVNVDFSKNSYTESDFDSIEYVVLGKAFDRDNYSTQMRASCIINDMKIFARYIFVGVGDGCQGFWYEENIPEWVKPSEEVQNIIQSHTIPNGGGAFFPSYISAYGLIGLIVLLLFLKDYKKTVNRSLKIKNREVSLIYHTGMIVMVFSFWFTISMRDVPIPFLVLCLPLFNSGSKSLSNTANQ